MWVGVGGCGYMSYNARKWAWMGGSGRIDGVEVGGLVREELMGVGVG